MPAFRNKFITAKILLFAAVVPVLIYGYAAGPPAYETGDPAAPDRGGNCTDCHSGTALNAGGGKVQIALSGPSTYVAGQAQQISVTISDPKQRAWGFEFSARTLSNNSQAGDLKATDSTSFVQCADGSIKTTACANGLNTQFIQQTSPKTGSGSATFTFQWTPPATAAGTVVFYAAGNAANGDGTSNGDHIYTTSIQLTPAAATPAPAITAVVNAATLQGTMAASTYVAIGGTNLSTTSPGRTWAPADFTANGSGAFNIPTSLDGTTVTVGGVPAYVEYVSPGQVNIITPATPATGNGVPVVVSVNGQPSAAFSITLQNLAPSFFAWSPSTTDFGKYLVAQHSADYSNVGKVGLFPGTSPTFTTPARPGETIILYGTGFGQTSPAFTPGLEYTTTNYSLGPTPTATLGGINAPVVFAGVVATLSDVYQFDITIPASAPGGDLPLLVYVNGTPSASGLITVQQ